MGEWTHATWDSENQKIVFVSGDKLYSWSMPNLTDLENAEPPEASIHFGVLSDSSATQPVVINNVKQSQSDLIYINGNLYDLNSEGLLIDDAANTANDLTAWANGSLYSAQSGGSDLIERWSFSLADEGGVGLESVSDQIGQNMALVTVTVSGEESPLLITADENNVLRFITDLESSAQEVENNNTPLEEEIDVEEGGDEDEQSSDSSGGSCAGAICPDSGGAAQPVTVYIDGAHF